MGCIEALICATRCCVGVSIVGCGCQCMEASCSRTVTMLELSVHHWPFVEFILPPEAGRSYPLASPNPLSLSSAELVVRNPLNLASF